MNEDIYKELKFFFGHDVTYTLLEAVDLNSFKGYIQEACPDISLPDKANGFHYQSTIILYTKDWFEKNKTTLAKDTYESVFSHELVHVFLGKKLVYNAVPWWLEESLVESIVHRNNSLYWCLPIGGYIMKDISVAEIEKVSQPVFMYQYGSRFLHYCFKKYGKNKFLDFINYFYLFENGSIMDAFENTFSASIEVLFQEWISETKKKHAQANTL